jgi:hypothetical protein
MISEFRDSVKLCGICGEKQTNPFLTVFYSKTNVKIICCSKKCVDFYLIGMLKVKKNRNVTFIGLSNKTNISAPKPKRMADLERVKQLIRSSLQDDV